MLWIDSREKVLLRDCSGYKMLLELCFVAALSNNFSLVVYPSVAVGFLWMPMLIGESLCQG